MACNPRNNISCPCDNLENLFVNASYFVDAFYGNDSTAIPHDEGHPYQTIQAVVSLVQPGEVVVVRPGNYSIPTLNLAGSIWYFEPGSNIVALITGFGSVYGYGNFIGQSPVVNYSNNVQPLFIQAQQFTTASDYAVVVGGQGGLTINVKQIFAPGGIFISAAVRCDATIDSFNGDGSFIFADVASSGTVNCVSQKIACSNLITSISNSIKINLTTQLVHTVGDYAIHITDNSTNISNNSQFNISLNRLKCRGLLNGKGIQAVTNVLLQPNLNINIQNISSQNDISSPIVLVDHLFCNLTYDKFAYSFTSPIPYIIVMGDVCVIHINGNQTYNANQVGDVGFAFISGSNFSGLRCKFIEFYITSQLIETQGNCEFQFDINNLTCISQASRSLIVNNSQGIVNIQKMISIHPDSLVIVSNNNLMQFNVGAWQFETNGSQIISNSARLQTRIGFFNTSSSSNTLITSSGVMLGMVIGSIRMDGSNNTGVVVRGTAVMDIGQIISNNSGNSGIFVEDPGQLYGRVGRIIMRDRSCIEFRSSLDSNLQFDWLTNGSDAYVVYVDGMGEVTMRGNAITAEQVKYPIFVVSRESKFNLDLMRMDIRECGAGIYVQAPQSEINIYIQHFHIEGNAGTAGVYAEGGTLTLSGDYFMRTSDAVPMILLAGDVNMCAKLAFVDTNYSVLRSSTTGDVWYEASSSVSQNRYDNVVLDIPNSTQTITIKGRFSTDGDFNINVVSADPNARVRILDGVFFSNSRNIISTIPLNFITNYSIGNGGLSNMNPIPSSGFIQNGGVF